VAVEGEAGVGKTRLLTHLRDLPEASTFRVFTARGSELERPFAFGVVRRLYEPALTMAGESERRRRLSGAARGAAAVFSALRKLGVSRRTQLTKHVAGAGLG